MCNSNHIKFRCLRGGVFLVAMLLSSFPVAKAQVPEKKSLRLLASAGQNRVGHVLFDWVDTRRREPATPEPSDLRQVLAEVWYPTSPDSEGKRSPYRARLESYRSVLDEKTMKILASVQTDWIEAGPVISSGHPFGVFIFSHGWRSRSSSYGTFLANLASNGFIVVGIDHPYMGRIALSDGRVTEPADSQFPTQDDANRFYADDVSFVIDQLTKLNEKDPDGRFTGTIGLKKIVAGGHSSGFPAASGAAVLDRRIKGLISFDSGVPTIVRREGLDIPLLLFRGETDSYTDLFFRGEKVHPKGTIYDVNFFRVHRSDFYDLMISGTTHNSVFDEYLFADDDKEAGAFET